MARRRLIFGLAAVFAGLTAVLVTAALAVQPFLLVIALPFAVTTYLLWFHATGRLADRAQRRQTATRRGGTSRRGFAEQFRERFGETTARSGTGQATGSNRHRRGDDARYQADARYRADAGRQRTRAEGSAAANGERRNLSPTEAYRVLGISPGADQETIKAAYREQVKQTHPDTAAGDEESFKRLNQAYERIKAE